MKEKHEGEAAETAQYSEDGDWSYLRANLDNPRHHLAMRLGSGLAAWIRKNWQPSLMRPARLELIARIPLGPRQAVALVEADGMHLLVATSADGAASFFPLSPSRLATPTESCSAEPSFDPVRSTADPGPSAASVQDRLRSPRSSPWGPTGRRLGFQGRVSW